MIEEWRRSSDHGWKGEGMGSKRRRKGQGDVRRGGRWSIRGEVRWGRSLLTKEECGRRSQVRDRKCVESNEMIEEEEEQEE